MAHLTLKGTLNLMGRLALKGSSGGTVKIGDAEALVQVTPDGSAQCTTATPVILPPPPGTPLDVNPNVWIVNSFNQTVTAGGKPIVALGMAMQGQTGAPKWPGMVLPSTNNAEVTINHVFINVQQDMAVIFPSGGSATFTESGQ